MVWIARFEKSPDLELNNLTDILVGLIVFYEALFLESVAGGA